MNTLEKIAKSLSTDKGTTHSYLPLYELLFAPFRHSARSILEIGVADGSSLLLWEEYFPNAQIVGLDVNEAPKAILGHPRIRHFRGDGYTAVNEGMNAPYSIMIDDGPHSKASQEFFCAEYVQLLTQDGIAIVEDIQNRNIVPDLVRKIPPGYHHVILDFREVKGRYDDVALMIFRRTNG